MPHPERPSPDELRVIERGLRDRGLYKLLAALCRDYGVTLLLVLEKSNQQRVTYARDAVFHRLRSRGFSFSEIGIMLGFHHATVMGGVERYKARDNGKLLT